MDVMTIKILVLVVVGLLILGFAAAELLRPRRAARHTEDVRWSRL